MMENNNSQSSDSESASDHVLSKRQQRAAQQKKQRESSKKGKKDAVEKIQQKLTDLQISQNEGDEDAQANQSNVSAAADCDKNIFEHYNMPPMKGPRCVEYCPDCGMPFEYCEYAEKGFACSAKQNTADSDQNNDGLPNAENAENAVKKEQGKSGKGKKGVEKKLEVTIQKQTRSKRKTITVITGLENFGVKLEVCAKLCAKQFACGASVNMGIPGQLPCIEVQGDVEVQLPHLLHNNFGVAEESIIVLPPK